MPQVLEAPVGLLRLRELCDTLEGHEGLLQSFFDLSPDLLAVISIDGFFLQVNQSWQKILGWTEETMEETPWLHLIHPEDQPAMREAVGHLVTHDLNGLVCRTRHADGHYRVVEFSATKWRGGTSNLIGRLVPATCLSCPEASSRLTWRANGCNNCEQDRA
jgi:PAS domain S-box-containing protein